MRKFRINGYTIKDLLSSMMTIITTGVLIFSLLLVFSEAYKGRFGNSTDQVDNSTRGKVVSVREKKDVDEARDFTTGTVASKYTEEVEGVERYYLFIGGRVYDVDEDTYNMFSVGSAITYKEDTGDTAEGGG